MRFVELRADSDNPVLLDLHSIRKVEIMGSKGDKDYRMVKITQEALASPTVVELQEWAKLREWLLDVR